MKPRRPRWGQPGCKSRQPISAGRMGNARSPDGRSGGGTPQCRLRWCCGHPIDSPAILQGPVDSDDVPPDSRIANAILKGSHHVFMKPGELPLSIPVHGGKVKAPYVRKIEKKCQEDEPP